MDNYRELKIRCDLGFGHLRATRGSANAYRLIMQKQ